MKVPQFENYGPGSPGKDAPASGEPIAIIGIGARYPGAADPKTLWENILTRRRQFRRFREERLPFADYHDPDPRTADKTYGAQAAFIDGFEFDWRGHRIPKSTFDAHDIVHWLALDVALSALADAGITPATPLERDRVGVVLGNTLTGEFGRSTSLRVRWPYVRRVLNAAAQARGLPREILTALEETMEDYYKSVFPAPNEDMLVGNLSNTIAGRIANYMDFHGGAYVVDGACASSIIAIATAANYLAQGELDLGLAGGVDISLDTLEMIGFSKVGALTKGEMSVYDKAASGFIAGEGCGFIVMKRLEDARRDGDYVYAVVRGWGIASDGKGGMTAPDAYGQSLALRRAYSRAGYAPSTLDFVEGHGTGTALGDRIELEGIVGAVEAFGEAAPRSIGVTSFKSLVGHCKAAAGIGGVMKAILAVNQRVLPPTAGCRDPHPIFADRAQALYPIMSGEVRDPSATLRAGVSGMGFGGINSHVTLESGDAPSEKLKSEQSPETLLASHQDSEVLVLAGESPADLIARIDALLPIVQQISYAEMVDLSAKLASEAPSGSAHRAAVVAASPAELYAKLGELRTLLEKSAPDSTIGHDPRRDVWFGQGSARRVGFLFPGQGSQQLNMGRNLLARFPWARSLLQEAREAWSTVSEEAIDGLIYRSPEKAADAEQLDAWKKALAQTEIAQPAIVLTSLLWLERLRRAGIEPSATAGHSLGELTAFHAAGAFGRWQALALAGLRGKAMTQPADKAGCMASLRCGREEAERLLKSVEGYVVIANLNGPEQTIISGERPAVEQAVARAQAQQINGTLLNVSNAFHSKLVATAADYLRKHADLPDRPEQDTAKVFSSKAGSETLSGPLREHFADHILSQVDFIQAIQGIAAETDLLIEVGPGGVLSGLAGSNLRDAIALPVESTAAQDRDFNRVLAASFAAGCSINWNEVYAERLIRPFVDPAERNWLVNPCERPFAPKVPNPAPLSIGSSGLEQAIVERAGIDADQAEWYLQQRGDFLADVIAGVASADLRAQGLVTSDLPRITAAAAPAIAAAANAATADHAPQAAAAGSISERVGAFIMNLIADRTGFPLDSIEVSMSMLDDLGLDSIKTAEVAGATAREFEVADKVDPTVFAKASVDEVIRAITAAMGGSDKEGGNVIEIERLQTHGGNHLPTWVRSFAMRCLPDNEPLDPDFGYWTGRSFALLHEGTEADLAKALAAKLTAAGATAVPQIYENAAENLDALLGQGITGFVSILPRSAAPGTLDLERITSIVGRLHALTALPLRKSEQPPYEVFFVQFGEGHFGHDFGSPHPENIGAMAFAASWHLERNDLRVRVIDTVPAVGHDDLYAYLSREAAVSGAWGAAGYDADGQRLIVRPEVLSAANFKPLDIAWTGDDVVLVTGGAKGITAECALAFAEATGVRMALVGSSPAPGADADPATNEIAATLERFAAAGLTARYYATDITDAKASTELVAKIQSELGKPTGLFHGAAVNHTRRLDQTPADRALSEIRPKLLGLVNMLDALDSGALKQVIGFTSIIGVTGMGGSGWYGWSNELAHLVLRRYQMAHPHVHSVSVAYSVWDEVGMGVKGGGLKALARMGIAGIPVREGLASFLHAALHDCGTQQLVVTARVAGLDTWNVEAFTQPSANRYLENIVAFHPNVECISRVRLTAERDRFVIDHDYKGSLLFPTVFGLEAMAQAVAYVIGAASLETVVIRDITLERPIVVDREKGLEIEIHAELLETDEKGRRVVRAGITTEHSSFTHDHFSAVYCLDETPTRPEIGTPETTAFDIEPLADLYGTGLLFQGRRFQRIKEVRALTETHATTFAEIADFASAIPGEDSSDGPFILGDPYYRDIQLQSGQLSIPREQALPVKIGAIHVISNQGHSGFATCVLDLTEKTETDIYSVVTSVDASGEVFEYIEGYHARILDRIWTNPSVDELIHPQIRDRRLLELAFTEAAADTRIGPAPAFNVTYHPNLPAMEPRLRHTLEQTWADQALRRYAEDQSMILGDHRLVWDGHGRPTLEGNIGNLGISISHDERLCVIAVGAGSQGCDVTALGKDTDWAMVLGNRGTTHLADLQHQGCPPDEAGGILWAALEAAFKACGNSNLQVLSVRFAKTHALVNIQDTNTIWQVLAVPVNLTRGPRRVVAAVCGAVMASASEIEEMTTPILSVKTPGSVPDSLEPVREMVAASMLNMGFDLNAMGVDGTINVIRGHAAVSMHFPVSMKEASNLSRTVNYANYVQWFGRAREVAFQPLSAPMIEQFATQQWGMVTNYTDTRIFDEATYGEIVEALFWGKQTSETSLEAYAFWRARSPNGEYRPLAFTRQMSSWVAIVGHGLVEPRPLPKYATEYFEKMEIGNEISVAGIGIADIEKLYDEEIRGDSRLRIEAAPGKPGHLVYTESFSTDQTDSNVVGNIYFSNYSLWQAKLVDRIVHRLAPEVSRHQSGELRGFQTRISHLREAMPFDTIEVKAYVTEIFERGMGLSFEYFKVLADGGREKLATGTYVGAWYVRAPDGSWICSNLPPALSNQFQQTRGHAALPRG